VVCILVGAVAVHLTLLLTTATSADAVAVATLVTMVAAVATTGGLVVARAYPQQLVRTWRRARAAGLLPIAAVTCGAFVLRLAVTRGIWVDEAISISSAGKPFGQMLHQLQTTDVQPPLHSVLLWLTIRIAGSGELAIRSSSMIAGTLVVPVLYLLGRELYDRRTGTVAALIGAVSPLAIWYSQEGRMYALYMLFAVVALLAQVRALRGGRAWWWVLYAVATAALLWTQYLSVLFIAGQQLVFAHAWSQARRSGEPVRRRLIGWLGALALVVVLLLPLLPYLGNQLAEYAQRGAGFSGVPAQAGSATSQQPLLSVYSIIANLLWALSGYHADRTMELLAALWPLGIVVALALLGRRLELWTRRLLVLVVVPIGALFVIGLQRPDLFELRYVAAVVPVMALLMGRAVTALAPRRLVRPVAAGLVVVLLVALADQQLNGANPRLYDFRGAVREVAAEARPGDQVLYNPVYLESVVHYYGPKLRLTPIDDWRAVAHARGRIFVVGSFFDKRDISARTGAVLARLERERALVDTFRKPQIRVWVFR
jgi:hypothetical protein